MLGEYGRHGAGRQRTKAGGRGSSSPHQCHNALSQRVPIDRARGGAAQEGTRTVEGRAGHVQGHVRARSAAARRLVLHARRPNVAVCAPSARLRGKRTVREKFTIR